MPDDAFVCYRGQSDAGWDLIPSFYRGLDQFEPQPNDVDDGEWLGQLERDIYREFDRKGRRHAPEGWDFHNPWHRMILAQHYGLPTRLLDWSKSPFVAVYFAVTANPERDGALWCLDISAMPFPNALGRRRRNSGFRLQQIEDCIDRDRLSFHWPVSRSAATGVPVPQGLLKPQAIPCDQSGDPERDGFLVVIEPPVLEGRLHSQKSLFTVYIAYDEHQFVWDQRQYLERIERHHLKDILTKVVIPYDVKKSLKRDLEASNLLDVDDIFPDLPGLVERLKRDRNETFSYWQEDRKTWPGP